MVDAANEVAPPVPGRQSLVQKLIAPGTAEVEPRAAAEPTGPAPQLPHYSAIQRAFANKVQAKEAPGGDVHAAAAQGISGPASQLPHLEQIQRSFGRHDVSHVQAHTGPEAKAGSQAMGAEAFATGNHVAFTDAPSLHITAHEAAHIVQQRGGVQLAGGVGRTGDTYEQHADQVADLVVRGESAEGLLDQHAGDGAASTPGVQRELEGSSKRKEWPGGPTVARKSTMHTLTEYVDWLRQVEAKYGASRAETLQRLRRLYYSDYTGGAGPGFDKLISNAPGAGGPPMTTSDLPLAVINGLYETNAIVTPNGSQVDISHILADLDLHVAGGGIKAGAAEVRFGVNFEGVFTWVGDLASWWLEAKNTIAKRGGASVAQPDQVNILLSLVATKAAKDDLLGDVDAQVMADQFTTTTYVPVPEAGPPVPLTTQNMPLSQMLMQYYGQEPAAKQGQPGGAAQRGSKPTSSNRFHYFVASARPLIPHTRGGEHPLTVALASDAPAKIREHLANTARMFVDDNPLHGTPADLTTYGPLLDEVAMRFLHFLTTGLATGDAPWP